MSIRELGSTPIIPTIEHGRPFIHRHTRLRQLVLELQVLVWYASGRRGLPPKLRKYADLRSLLRSSGLDIVVETGTYLGDFIAYISRDAKEVYSVELSGSLYRDATKRFGHQVNVHLIHGNSKDVLPTTLENLNCACFFWLDAHCSSGVTVGSESPILAELKTIHRHSLEYQRKDLVVIDDAREFVGTNGYPTLVQLREFVEETIPGLSFEVKDDMIICRS